MFSRSCQGRGRGRGEQSRSASFYLFLGFFSWEMLFFLLGFAPLCFPHAYDGEDDEWGRTDHEMLVYFYLQKGFLLVDSSRTGPQDRKPR
jgi:hypothetical protein